MDSGVLEILNWAFLVVPFVIGILAIRIGATQVREFHQHTHDSGVIMSMIAFSRLDDDGPESEAAVQASATKPTREKATSLIDA